jgi:hypothetical protein
MKQSTIIGFGLALMSVSALAACGDDDDGSDVAEHNAAFCEDLAAYGNASEVWRPSTPLPPPACRQRLPAARPLRHAGSASSRSTTGRTAGCGPRDPASPRPHDRHLCRLQRGDCLIDRASRRARGGDQRRARSGDVGRLCVAITWRTGTVKPRVASGQSVRGSSRLAAIQCGHGRLRRSARETRRPVDQGSARL